MYDGILSHKLKKLTCCGESILCLTYYIIHILSYTYISTMTIFLVNRSVSPFNKCQKYLYRLLSQDFWDGQRRGPIVNRLRLRHLYISTSYNRIWSFQQSRGALALQSSTKLQGIISNATILYIIFLQNSRTTWRRRCSIQHVWIVDLIRSKPFVFVTSSSFNHISN